MAIADSPAAAAAATMDGEYGFAAIASNAGNAGAAGNEGAGGGSQHLSAEEANLQLARCRSALDETRAQLAEAREALAEKTRQFEQTSQELRDCAAALAALRAVVDAANAPIVAVDRTGRVVEWNRKAAEVFRCEGKAALRKQLADWLYKADRPGFQELEAAVLSGCAYSSAGGGGELQRGFRVRCRSEDEPWHELLLCASPRRSVVSTVASAGTGAGVGAGGGGPDGVVGATHPGDAGCSPGGPFSVETSSATGSSDCETVEGVLYVGQDLAGPRRERVQAEAAVQDLARLVRSLNAPIIGLDSKGVVNEWNRKAALLTGFSDQEAVGKSLVRDFITEDFADSVQTMLTQALAGQDITNYEFPLLTKGGQRREILCSATARRDREEKVVGVIIVGQDITELRSESKMLANYVRICGAAVWSLRGNAMTGVVTDSKTKEIEHLISQQAQMDVCDPRMVLWRASFVSILKTMCQNFWLRRKGAQPPSQSQGQRVGSTSVFTTDFGYEFCFEAPNGSVKWYKVQGHLIQECSYDSQFEVTGSMQEVTSMLIDKVMGDRWQKWWNRMCHMVFDATLLVDTQEYRVLNAWGEEKVFGCKLQSHHPLLHLIKPEDTVSLKEAFNEVTFKGFERGRTLHLLRPGCDEYTPAQCFLLSADQENPNECMMGIRMQDQEDNVSVLWDVAKPNPVLTLEDLARLKSGLKRSHRRPSRANVRRSLPHRSRSSDPHTSSHSLSSIPEDLHGEFEEDILSDRGSEAADSGAEGTESLRSSSKSSTSSKSSEGSASEVGVCNSSPARSACEEPLRDSPLNATGQPGHSEVNPFRLGRSSNPRARISLRTSSSPPPALRSSLPSVRVGPAKVKLKWAGRVVDDALDLDAFPTVQALREHIDALTGVPPSRQTLILAGKRLPLSGGVHTVDAEWTELRAAVKPGQALMLVGSVPPTPERRSAPHSHHHHGGGRAASALAGASSSCRLLAPAVVHTMVASSASPLPKEARPVLSAACSSSLASPLVLAPAAVAAAAAAEASEVAMANSSSMVANAPDESTVPGAAEVDEGHESSGGEGGGDGEGELAATAASGSEAEGEEEPEEEEGEEAPASDDAAEALASDVAEAPPATGDEGVSGERS